MSRMSVFVFMLGGYWSIFSCPFVVSWDEKPKASSQSSVAGPGPGAGTEGWITGRFKENEERCECAEGLSVQAVDGVERLEMFLKF